MLWSPISISSYVKNHSDACINTLWTFQADLRRWITLGTLVWCSHLKQGSPGRTLIMFGMHSYLGMYVCILGTDYKERSRTSSHNSLAQHTTLTYSGLAPLSLPLCIWVETSQQQESGLLSMTIQGQSVPAQHLMQTHNIALWQVEFSNCWAGIFQTDSLFIDIN